MRPIFCLFLAICLSQPSYARSSDLSTALLELQYSLTVEWDQEDQAFREAAVRQFAARVEEADLTDLDQLLGSFQLNELEALKLRLASATTGIDVVDLALSESGRSAARGASWNGSVKLVGAVAAVAVVVVVYYYVAASRIRY
jgi:hypothetical protein